MTPNINDMRDRQSGVFGSLQHGCAVVGRASVALVILFMAGCAKDATKKKAGGDRAAKLEASGCRPCAMRVNVDALTPVSLLTCFQVIFLASTVVAIAA